MPIIKCCITCNKDFSVPSSRKLAKYCSIACTPRKGESNPNWKGGLKEIICKRCGKDFKIKRKDVRQNGNFCSLKCSTSYHSSLKAIDHWNNRFVKNCVVCQKEIRVKMSHKEIEGTYCSKECMAISYKEILKGENNPNYRNGGICNTKEYRKKAMIKYNINNPGKRKLLSQNSKAKRRNAIGKLSLGLSDKLYKLQKGLCVCCKEPLGNDYHLDHIIPIALGGTNTDDNIQLLRAKCNLVKSAKHPIDYMQSKGFLL